MQHDMSGHGNEGHMMMMMYFHGGYSEVILFDFWRINSIGGLIGSMIGCFLMGILYEGIKSYREYWMNGAFRTVPYSAVTNRQQKTTNVDEEVPSSSSSPDGAQDSIND